MKKKQDSPDSDLSFHILRTMSFAPMEKLASSEACFTNGNITIMPNKLSDIYVHHMRQVIEGRITLPAIRIEDRSKSDAWHLSDLEGCLYASFWSRTLPPDEFVLDELSVLRFFRGRLFEHAVALHRDISPLQKDGIVGTIDDYIVSPLDQSKFQPVEIKSVASGCSSFNLSKQVSWLIRTAAYCYIHEVQVAHFVVLFTAGNMADFLPWAIRERGHPRTQYIPMAIRSWSVFYSDSFLQTTWENMLQRKERLDHAIREDDPSVLAQFVKPESWRCALCRYLEFCPYREIDDK